MSTTRDNYSKIKVVMATGRATVVGEATKETTSMIGATEVQIWYERTDIDHPGNHTKDELFKQPRLRIERAGGT